MCHTQTYIKKKNLLWKEAYNKTRVAVEYSKGFPLHILWLDWPQNFCTVQEINAQLPRGRIHQTTEASFYAALTRWRESLCWPKHWCWVAGFPVIQMLHHLLLLGSLGMWLQFSHGSQYYQQWMVTGTRVTSPVLFLHVVAVLKATPWLWQLQLG